MNTIAERRIGWSLAVVSLIGLFGLAGWLAMEGRRGEPEVSKDRVVAGFRALEPRCEPLLPAYCTVPHAVVDPWDHSGGASDLNTCTSEVYKGEGVGPCKTLEEINRRCPQWYEQGVCVTFEGPDGQFSEVGGPRAVCERARP